MLWECRIISDGRQKERERVKGKEKKQGRQEARSKGKERRG